jgi:hypothetical protein
MTAEATRDEADLEETPMTSPTKTSDRRRALRTTLALLCVAAGALTIAPSSALANPPANDDFAHAHDLGGGSTASASGTNLDATAEPGEPDHDGFAAEASVWYRWTAPGDGAIRVNTCGSDFDTVLAVYTGSAIDALTALASNDQACGDQSRVGFTVTGGTTYRIAVDGYGGDQGAIELELRPANPPPNDDFANAHDLAGGSASGTNVDAAAEPGEPGHDGFAAAASVWYRWTAPGDGAVRVNTCGSDFDTVLAVYRGSAIDALTPLTSNDDACDLQSRVRFNAIGGTTYRIAVDGYGGQEGAIELELRPSNAFRFGKLKRNERRGTAKLTIKTSYAGDLKLARTELVKRATASAAGAGKVKLRIEPTRSAMRTLDRRGRVNVDAEVTFTPEGGEPKTKNKRLKLIKR